MSWKNELYKLVKPKLEKLDIGHQIWHATRVYKNCEQIAKEFKAVNMDALYAACLLHDIGQTIDFYNEHSHDSIKLATKLLRKVKFPKDDIILVKKIIRKHDDYAWIKNHSNQKPKSIESQIFQDADRLESLGAMGIARNFAWSGKHSKPFWKPKTSWKRNKIYGGNISVLHTMDNTLQIYKNLNTNTAKKIAKQRYQFTKLYIKQFIKEWN